LPPPPGTLSNHLNQAGEVHMVDVARKPKTERRAVARGSVLMRPETMTRLVQREAPKGEVLATARIAGILAAKRTHEIIPLCHAVALTHLDVQLDLDAQGPDPAVHVTAIADAYDRTGCEMEAMVAVSTACLTIYDMLKGIDRDILITDIKLMEKSGGRSGHYQRPDADGGPPEVVHPVGVKR
jgi:cyclic pyranopterin phosphate synthase